jgi:hypothetical protein
MSLFGFLGGNQNIRDAKGVDINKEDYKIKDADKMFGQTQEQFTQQAQRQQALAGRSDTLMDQLTQQASGQGPSITQQQLKQAQERNLAQQLAAVQTQRSGNPAAMQRQALREQSAQASNIAAQAAQGRLQEQLAAREQLGGMLGQQQQVVGELTKQYLGMGMDLRQAEQAALAQYNQLNVQQALGLANINAEQDRARQQGSQLGLGTALSSFGALGGMGAVGNLSSKIGGGLSDLFRTKGMGGVTGSGSAAPGGFMRMGSGVE